MFLAKSTSDVQIHSAEDSVERVVRAIERFWGSICVIESLSVKRGATENSSKWIMGNSELPSSTSNFLFKVFNPMGVSLRN
jgi:hypothetical protein